MKRAITAICVCATWAAPIHKVVAHQTVHSPSATSTTDAPVEANTYERTADARVAIKLFGASSADANCNSVGLAKITIIEPPSHGSISIKKEPLYPNYKPTSPSHKCNFVQTIGVNVYYRTNQSASGSDQTIIRQSFPSGRIIDNTYNIKIRDNDISVDDVNHQSGDIPLEIPLPKFSGQTTAESVFSGKENRVYGTYGVNPDCSSFDFTLVAIVQAPTHGSIRIEPEEPYAVFPEGSGYFKCNGSKLKEVRIYYKSEEGYVGPDTLSIRGKMGNGRDFLQSFVLSVK